MTKKFQIFVSSTYCDLVEERQAVIQEIINLGHIPIGMEAFQAGNSEQWQVIKKQIEEADYYIAIVAERYGSEKDGKSYTEMEYDYAREKNVPVAAFLLKENARAQWRRDRAEYIDNPVKVAAFRDKCEKLMVKYWEDKHELARYFVTSLTKMINDYPREGWVRMNNKDNNRVSMLDDLAQAIDKGLASTVKERLKQLYCGSWIFYSFSNWANDGIKSKRSTGNIIVCRTEIKEINDRLRWERTCQGEGTWIGYIFPMGDGSVAVIENLRENPSYIRFYIFFKEVIDNPYLNGAFIEYEDDYNKIRFRCCGLKRANENDVDDFTEKYANDIDENIVQFLSKDNDIKFEYFPDKFGNLIEAINIHVSKNRIFE